MKNSKLKKILLGLLKLLYYIAIAFVCLIVGILIYYIISVQIHADDKDYKPGISIYTIVSPSMTPEIKVYDVVVNVKVTDPEKIEIGDIITFKSQAATSEGMTITHRVIAREKLPDGTYEYMTQGDANPEPDSSYVTFDNVIGEKILIIPGLGKVQFLIANKKSWLFLLLIPISIYLIKEIYKLIDLLGLKKKVKKVIDEPEEEPQIDHEKQEALKQQLRKELFGSEEKQSHPSDDELRELIDTITSKTLAGDIKAASSLLGDLMATSIMDKVDPSDELEEDDNKEEKIAVIKEEKVSIEDIKKLAEKKDKAARAEDDDDDEEIKIVEVPDKQKENKVAEKLPNADTDFYTRSMDLSAEDFELDDDFKEKKLPVAVKILIFLIVVVIIAAVGYFIWMKQ